MARMEFLTQNLINTTTQLLVDSNTVTADRLFDRKINLLYETVGFNSNTSTIISVSLSSAAVISHILIQNHNLKQFRGFYNSVTANSLFSETTNSATSSYFTFASVTVNSIQLQMDTAQSTSTEKAIGQYIIAERRLQFERNPTSRDFKPKKDRKQFVHELADGGVKIFNVKDKFKTRLKWKFLTESFKNNLETEYERSVAVYFVQEPTTTAWNGDAFEVAWVGDFDFTQNANIKSAGFGGSLDLRETSGG